MYPVRALYAVYIYHIMEMVTQFAFEHFMVIAVTGVDNISTRIHTTCFDKNKWGYIVLKQLADAYEEYLFTKRDMPVNPAMIIA